MAASDPSGNTVIVDRLRRLFASGDGQYGVHSDVPQRRGLAITVCALLSCLLWVTFSLQESYTATIDLPTGVTGLDDERALAVLPPPTVRVEVRGEGASLLRLYYDRPVVPIDAQLDEVDLRGALPELPKNVELQDIRPRSVNLRKEPRTTRRVPVVLRADIDTPPTHDLLFPPVLEPDSVDVAGARSIVDRIEAWPTEHLDVDGLRDTLVTTVALSDTLAGLVERGLEPVTVTIAAAPFTEGVREIPVTVERAPPGQNVVTLVPSIVRVRYNVLLSDYERSQRATDFFATVPYEVIRADTTGRVRPDLHLPAGVVLRDVDIIPSTLRYFNVLIDE